MQLKSTNRNVLGATVFAAATACAVYEGPGETADGGLPGSSYDGSQTCVDLLAANTPWSCPTQPPAIPDDPGELICQRDTYVLAAVSYCWAAECKGRDGEFEEAQMFEDSAFGELAKADELCSCVSVIGDGESMCYTEPFYACPACD